LKVTRGKILLVVGATFSEGWIHFLVHNQQRRCTEDRKRHISV